MIKVRIKKLPQARTGYQVQGALVNDVPSMGGADYNAYIGKPKLRESKYITAVPREEANLEAEGGETVYGDINGDGIPEHQIIKGPRHHSGGVPLSLPEDTFIFSDTRGMMIKDPKVLAMFGKGGTNKSFTPAELAKQYDIQKYRKILEDPDSDAIERKSAELMMKKYVIKLGCLALAQESMKGFPQGIPAVAKPCMEARGITEEQILPAKEISTLNDQLKKQMSQQENSEETMESENEQNPQEEAQEMNQGQPVAQSQEQPQMSQEEMMMMYGGGMRRLRRAQEGMQQPSPEEMAMMQQQQQQGAPQEQGGGEDEMMQVIQEVQSALQRGAEPAEVVMSLLENGVQPEEIVQVFTQLGASQEEATGLVQQVMQQGQGGGQEQMGQEGQPMSEEEAMMMQQQQMQQQAPPMAEYGMSMGGYDMPFFDIPQAEYGMSMGAGMSQNYQGRSERVPASGPITRMVKAQTGIIVDGSNMTDQELERAIWNAKQKHLEEWKAKNPNKDPKTSGYKEPQLNVKHKGTDGKITTQRLKSSGFTIPSGEDIANDGLEGFPNTASGRVAASQYLLIKSNLENPTVRAEIIKNTKEIVDNPEAWRGKNATTTDLNRKWSVKYGNLPEDDEIIKAALMHQKRNLMFEANDVDPQLFSDIGNRLDKPSDVISKKYVNPKTGQLYTLPEATAAIKSMNDKGFTTVAAMSTNLGVPLDPSGRDRVLQQSTMHGYAKAYQDYEKGAYNDNPDVKYAMDNFLGNVSLVHSGAADESSMGKLYGAIGNKISPLDDTYDYTNNTWYGHGAGKSTTYGDTTAGHKYMVGKRNLVYEDIPADELTEEDAKKTCPCHNSDGTEIEIAVNPDGSCPCTEDQEYPVPGSRAQTWLQDTIKTTGAFSDLMGIKKYMPYGQYANLGTPRPTYLDPTRELAANSEQANIQTQGAAQFAGAQGLSSRSAGIQGQASKNAADVLAKYNNANSNIANQFELKANDIRNQNGLLNQATTQRMYDQNTVANQQFDNSKLALKNQVRNYYANGITNKWRTDALNQMYENYRVHPESGGEMAYRPTPKTVTGQGAGSGKTVWQTAYDDCKENNPNMSADDLIACANGGSKSQGLKSNSTKSDIINTMYGETKQVKKGGETHNDNGYVHINSWLPFIL